MRLIQPKYEIIYQEDDLLGAYEQSEIGARTCYKSENVIKKNEDGRSETAKAFVDKLMNVNKHGSIAEHGTIYLRIPHEDSWCWFKYQCNPFSKMGGEFGEREDNYGHKLAEYFCITTNLRVINENNWWDDLKYICRKTENHEPRITIRFFTQIAISREANRHRVHSPSEQSTRYCNYSKDKFDNEISINIPEFVKDSEELEYLNNNSFYNYCDILSHCYYNNYNDFCKVVDTEFSMIDYWLFGNLAAEFAYMGMLRKGAKPEQARTVLPLDTNTELVHTAYLSDWIKFLDLRCSENAHPDIRVLALQIREEFKNNGWIDKE